ncbi:RTA1 domain-containing protein [Talaromyces proteolyticus]|uniref:RTA1 domain-containing protein n=1 Tax=Talaromyces proteolyticus TaxID=1131652 RepID=A0AAD4PYN7_9EURO|nr:RTA1 domain-containing protein [Talaromyces proteolyticus]KAH8697919.1 RTA1 domain-containing protein [Talaromyces proteolyticus]
MPVETGVPSSIITHRDATAPAPLSNGPRTTMRPTLTIRDDFDPHVSIPPLTLNLPSNTCFPTIAPDKNGYVPPTECNALYEYYPSFQAAVAFTVVFGALLMVHLAQAIALKTKFVWVIIMGLAWEFVAFLTRSLSTKHQQDSTIALITQLFILLAPLWVNAFDYMVLARMIHYFLPEKRVGIFKPSLLAVIFVFLDFGSFVIQLIGGGMAGPGADQSTMTQGVHIYMGGIGIQEAFIVVFLIVAILFHRKMHRLDRMGALVGDKTRWKGLIYALYFSLSAITVRIIYRLVEFSDGTDASSPIISHEWFVYVFDAVPMVFAAGVWCIVHPGKVLKGPGSELPPSGLRKICCCSCCCRGRKSKVPMKRLPSDENVSEELRPIRQYEENNHQTSPPQGFYGNFQTISTGYNQVPRQGHSAHQY